MIVFPPCKINVGLFITGKREDGFHNLESLFYSIPLFDALEVIARKEEQGRAYLNVSGLPVPGDSSNNIVLKAYQLLNERFSLPSVDVYLHKAIPMGAGLGGGSANGAYMLRILKEVFNLPLSRDELSAFAADLGSDCPFFIEDNPCFVSGRGEILEPTDFSLQGKFLVLLNPGIHISTAEAFSSIKLREAPQGWKNVLLNENLELWQGSILNDFESPIANAHPRVKYALNQLKQLGAAYVSMSGTGSTCYGIFHSEPDLTLIKGNYQLIKLLAL